MRYLIIDSVKLSTIEADSKAAAAAKYARRNLPHDALIKLYRLRVLEMDLATDFNVLATRHGDHIESVANQIPPDSQFRKEATDAHQP